MASYEDPAWTPVSLANLKAVIQRQDDKNARLYATHEEAVHPEVTGGVTFATVSQVDQYLYS